MLYINNASGFVPNFFGSHDKSYIIMLLFMYYNGYIIISCLIGAIVGRFIFCYEPLGSLGANGSAQGTVSYDKESDDRKCCL